MMLGDFLWSNTSNYVHELVPGRVLDLVGEFSRGKDSSSGLGRTGRTGRVDRSDRCESGWEGLISGS